MKAKITFVVPLFLSTFCFSQSFTSTPVTSATVSTAYSYALTTNANAANVVTATTLPSWLTLEQVSTYAGSFGSSGFIDGAASVAKFSAPDGVALDASGNLYVADILNHSIRKISSAGVVTTLAGNGTAAFVNGPIASAQFSSPRDVAIDASGNIYVADTGNHSIRKITPAGVVSTMAGSGSAGFANGTGTAAQFNVPFGVAVDNAGNVYVADGSNNSIRKITSAGVVTTLAGNGTAGSTDGTGSSARFNNPTGVAVDASGNVFVADFLNHLIRKITSAGVVSTIAGNGSAGFTDGTGTSAQFNKPFGVVLDAAGNIYVADGSNNRIRKITTAGVVSTIAGNGTNGFANGTGANAMFKLPRGIAIDDTGTLFIGDESNNLIRKINMHDFNITGTPTSLNVGGANSVSLSLTDGNNSPVTQNFTITVADLTTWTGTTDTGWNTAGNWDNGIPTSSLDAIIPNVTNKPVINTANMVCNNLTINASSALTINSGKSLTVSSNLTNNGTFIINSDATNSGSLIVTGTSTGSITYNRYLTSGSSTKWHLIGAPIGSQSINTFVTTSANNVATSGVNYSVTPYNNTVVKTDPAVWTHWTTDGTGAGNVSGVGNFVAGKGYEILTTADGTVNFTGTVPVANVNIAITKPASNNAWNLIGNPYPSSIFANSNADATNNFISVNNSALDPSFVAFYLWNPVTSVYDLVNQASSATYIAPGQGFFVKSVSAGGTVNFTTAMRTNQAVAVFQRAASPTTPDITLIANDGSTTKTTDIKYIGGTSLGLDPGYDAGRFGGVSTNFDVYTHLVNDNGVDFMLQVLPDNVYDTAVVPIGIDAKAGTQITFKASASNLPIGKKVFLEDRLLGLFNELNASSKFYTINLSKDTNGVGRFFLRTSNNLSTLGVNDFTKLNFSVIAQPKLNNIRVIGNIKQPAALYIYDTLGRLIKSLKLNDATDQNVVVPNLTAGIYILKLSSKDSQFSSKIAWY